MDDVFIIFDPIFHPLGQLLNSKLMFLEHVHFGMFEIDNECKNTCAICLERQRNCAQNSLSPIRTFELNIKHARTYVEMVSAKLVRTDKLEYGPFLCFSWFFCYWRASLIAPKYVQWKFNKRVIRYRHLFFPLAPIIFEHIKKFNAENCKGINFIKEFFSMLSRLWSFSFDVVKNGVKKQFFYFWIDLYTLQCGYMMDFIL